MNTFAVALAKDVLARINMPLAKAANIAYQPITIKAAEFDKHEGDSTKRLIKIMRNIVKNKGTFIP